ncbi:zinc finger protein 665-like isoform X2 [Periplaneta americana]|uniref:zinc finger protein 665-like isoform X2 n=1 Tax=Periplaneta americana TaxID=6978 RepID=UPI0037E8ED47
MPKSCSVPGCKTNYGTKYKSVFSFPSEEERRCTWLQAISRKDFTVTKCSGVCIDHFRESDIERELRATRLDGNKNSTKVIHDSDNDPSERFPNHGAKEAVSIISEVIQIPFLKEEIMHTVKVKEEPATDESYMTYNEATFTEVKHESDFMFINASEDETVGFVKIEVEDEITIEDHEIFPERSPSPDGIIPNSDTKSNCLDFGKKLYKCDICGRGFIQNNRLAVHRRSHTTKKRFLCDICGKLFAKKCYLVLHIRTHTRRKPFKCDDCGEEFTQQRFLVSHSCVDNGDNSLKCNVCSEILKHNNDLTVHYRKHNGLKPYKCNICGKNSTQSRNYSFHLRTHTAEKPFTCKVCCRGFRSKSHLTAHIFTHTGQKPFQCGVCGKGFRFRSTLIGHCHTHTRDKPFKSDVHNKSFTENRLLKMHSRSHKNKRPLCLR